MRHRANLGFTLLEVLICIALTSSLLLLTLTLNLGFSQKNQADIVAEEIKFALHYARDRAFKNDLPLTLAPLEKGRDWSKGMILFAEKDTILHQWEWHSKQVHVKWHGFRSEDYLTFSTALQHSTANGRFLIVTDSQYKIQIIVNRLGHLRQQIG